MKKFSEILEAYLEERDRLNGDHYENRSYSERLQG
jgi:hypothetical protein